MPTEKAPTRAERDAEHAAAMKEIASCKYGVYIAAQSNDGPFWMVMRDNGNIIAMRVPSEKIAKRIAKSMDIADQIDGQISERAEALVPLMLEVNRSMWRIRDQVEAAQKAEEAAIVAGLIPVEADE